MDIIREKNIEAVNKHMKKQNEIEMRRIVWDGLNNQSNENLIELLQSYSNRMKEEYQKVSIANMSRDIEDTRKIIDKLWINHLVARG